MRQFDWSDEEDIVPSQEKKREMRSFDWSDEDKVMSHPVLNYVIFIY